MRKRKSDRLDSNFDYETFYLLFGYKKIMTNGKFKIMKNICSNVSYFIVWVLVAYICTLHIFCFHQLKPRPTV